MKRKHSVKESIDMVVTSDHHPTKETILDSRFTSFLEKDHFFLTPWSWNPNASKNQTSSTKKKEFLSFHPESYFSYEVIIVVCNSSILTYLFLFLVYQCYQCLHS